MRKSAFVNGIRFYVNGNYRQAYKVYTSPNGVMFIKKGGSYQGDVLAITNDGIHVTNKVLDHISEAFVPFSAMELIIEDNNP